MTVFHIIAGLLALGAGATAMSASKGSTLHRQAGTIFVYAMMVMSATGTVMAALKPSLISVVAGSLTFYLVCTALFTVRRTVEDSRVWITGLMVMALVVGALGMHYGLVASGSPGGKLQGVPAFGYYLFASVALLGAVFDARLLRAGRIEGTRRLSRHLGRMGLAMFIATASFFLGQAKLLPEELRNFKLLAIPVVLVLLHLIYWRVRMLRKQSHVHSPRAHSTRAHS